MKKRRPIVITWVDSTSGLSNWTEHDRIRRWMKGGPVTIRSAGILLKETKRYYGIALSAHSEQACHLMMIPKGCVKKVRRLK